MMCVKTCNSCGSKKVFVCDTRTNDQGVIVRKRICYDCGNEFKTLEIHEQDTIVNITAALSEITSLKQRITELYNSLKVIDEVTED